MRLQVQNKINFYTYTIDIDPNEIHLSNEELFYKTLNSNNSKHNQLRMECWKSSINCYKLTRIDGNLIKKDELTVGKDEQTKL